MTAPGPGVDAGPDGRAAELAAALAAVRGRIEAAARAAGRDPAEVTLLAVTKTWPATDVAHLLDLGLEAFGEAKEQEGSAKAADVTALRPGARPHWRVIGRVQRNKARSLVRWADAVDAVDSSRLATALDRAAGQALDEGERDAPLGVLVQVSLDADPGRGGVAVGDVAALADRVDASAHLRLDGLMTVLPQAADPGAAFARFAELAVGVRAAHPGATTVSAGMSGDLDDAIAHGSTCVRVGTALLGGRPIAFRVSE